MSSSLSRCPVRACAVRWRIGPDRLCVHHHREQIDLYGAQTASEQLSHKGEKQE